MNATGFIAVAALIAGSSSLPYAVLAQTQAGTTRTQLQQHDLSAPGREVVQVRVGFDPGVAFPSHSHPGEEIVYVLEGSLEYRVEGKPPVILEAGDVLFIPAGAAHVVRNVGRHKAVELATYIVEKGKPLLTLIE